MFQIQSLINQTEALSNLAIALIKVQELGINVLGDEPETAKKSASKKSGGKKSVVVYANGQTSAEYQTARHKEQKSLYNKIKKLSPKSKVQPTDGLKTLRATYERIQARSK